MKIKYKILIYLVSISLLFFSIFKVATFFSNVATPSVEAVSINYVDKYYVNKDKTAIKSGLDTIMIDDDIKEIQQSYTNTKQLKELEIIKRTVLLETLINNQYSATKIFEGEIDLQLKPNSSVNHREFNKAKDIIKRNTVINSEIYEQAIDEIESEILFKKDYLNKIRIVDKIEDIHKKDMEIQRLKEEIILLDRDDLLNLLVIIEESNSEDLHKEQENLAKEKEIEDKKKEEIEKKDTELNKVKDKLTKLLIELEEVSAEDLNEEQLLIKQEAIDFVKENLTNNDIEFLTENINYLEDTKKYISLED